MNEIYRASLDSPTRLMHTTRLFAAIGCTALAASVAVAQQPRLTISPAAPAPGSIVRLTLESGPMSDSIVAVEGSMSGEQLHFRKAGASTWRAIGPVPVDATGSVSANVVIERASSVFDTVGASVDLPKPKPAKPGARPRALAVSSRFTRPLDAETEARIARENATARDIGRKSHDTPRMWSSAFVRPRAATVTSRFGSGRMFNGTLTSRHLGVDFRGAAGDPVRAANRGVVALVDNFFLAGNVVYIDHGDGVVTGYFHLSKTLVAAGDTVERGQEIGLVGATGRVTGPHLHWSARYGAVTVNPLDLVAIGNP
jgi:murein DD-endopeptidase MepM/ murein hydrolase activator NlpD